MQKRNSVTKLGLRGLSVLLVFLAAADVILNYANDLVRVTVVVSIYLVLYFLYRQKKFDATDVGLEVKHMKRGAVAGVLISVVVAVVFTAVFLVDRSVFADNRYDFSLWYAVFRVLIVLPVYVVFLEEMVFRGLIPAVVIAKYGKRAGYLASSLLFGMWHVLSGMHLPTIEVPLIGVLPAWTAVIGVVIVTSLVGYLFVWLRYRYESLLTPLIIHWTINGMGIVLAALASKAI